MLDDQHQPQSALMRPAGAIAMSEMIRLVKECR